MKIRLQMIMETADGDVEMSPPLVHLERDTLTLENLGMTLAEAQDLLASVQAALVAHQVAEYSQQQRKCPYCGAVRARKGHHDLVMRTLFGQLTLTSPRFYTCACQSTDQKSCSPLAECLPQRTAPELLYLESKWAALMSYGLTAELLQDVLPIDVAETSVKRHTQQVARRYEQELGEEQPTFITGCPMEWETLPDPDMPLTVGLDGGYIHARDGNNRKAGWFEVMVGKSLSQERADKCFGFVNGYDQKPRRRIFEMLKSQGLQMNQGVTFLSDGGDTVRDLQFYLSPQSEHWLDWFHITMRLTVIRQMVKGLPTQLPLEYPPDFDHEFERVKWFLWHGNVFRALQTLDMLLDDLEVLNTVCPMEGVNKLLKTTYEFQGYIQSNRTFIPNYGDRYRYGEIISTAFVESTVNQVISKRFVKKQQMRWTTEGAHLLLQVRTQVLNDDWRETFARWYPGMQIPSAGHTLVA